MVSSGYLQRLQRQAESHAFQPSSSTLQDDNFQTVWQASDELEPDDQNADHVMTSMDKSEGPNIDSSHEHPIFSRHHDTAITMGTSRPDESEFNYLLKICF